jgi:hypothetical protein
MREHARANRATWDGMSDRCRSHHGAEISARPDAWGAWRHQESGLRLLPEVSGQPGEQLQERRLAGFPQAEVGQHPGRRRQDERLHLVRTHRAILGPEHDTSWQESSATMLASGGER